MHRWLKSFAYRTTLSWWIFALAGLLALGIALLTDSWSRESGESGDAEPSGGIEV